MPNVKAIHPRQPQRIPIPGCPVVLTYTFREYKGSGFAGRYYNNIRFQCRNESSDRVEVTVLIGVRYGSDKSSEVAVRFAGLMPGEQAEEPLSFTGWPAGSWGKLSLDVVEVTTFRNVRHWTPQYSLPNPAIGPIRARADYRSRRDILWGAPVFIVLACAFGPVGGLVAFLFLYFLPSIIGSEFRKSLFFYNLLLGWTVIGWIVILLWSLRAQEEGLRARVEMADAQVNG